MRPSRHILNRDVSPDVNAHDTIIPERYFDLETIQLNVLAVMNIKE
jgi:hypothetical protein